MTPERAMEILNPNHKEKYDSLETVNEACRFGINAIREIQDAKKTLKGKIESYKEIIEKLKEIHASQELITNVISEYHAVYEYYLVL